MRYAELDTPALIIDLDAAQANIDEMTAVAAGHGVRLRPHVKTHKMPELARLQLAAGAAGITCAKVGEAEVMADAGCDDILIAFPLWGRAKLDRLAALRERARVRVSLDSVEVADQLGGIGGRARPVEVLVEVDTGLGRLGRPPGAPTAELVNVMVDGYTDDQVNSTFSRVNEAVGIVVVAVWDYYDGMVGGNSQFYILRGGQLYESAGDLYRWLSGDPDDPDTPATPGDPSTWTGSLADFTVADLRADSNTADECLSQALASLHEAGVTVPY